MLLEAANWWAFQRMQPSTVASGQVWECSLPGRRWICKARWIAWHGGKSGPPPGNWHVPCQWLGKWVSCSTGGYIVNWRAYIQKLWLLDRCYLAQLVDETSTLLIDQVGSCAISEHREGFGGERMWIKMKFIYASYWTRDGHEKSPSPFTMI